MITRMIFSIAGVMLAVLTPPAMAAGDAERGALLADTCLGCHGIAGYRNAYPSYRVPKLGGLDADYIVIALQGYRSAMRAHPTMQAQAASLDDQDMQDLAAYFASQANSSRASRNWAARTPRAGSRRPRFASRATVRTVSARRATGRPWPASTKTTSSTRSLSTRRANARTRS